MEKKNKMVYKSSVHALLYENEDREAPFFSMLLNTLELEYDLRNGELLGARGYLPLVQAVRCPISLARYEEGHVFLKGVRLGYYHENYAYDLLREVPAIKKYFKVPNVRFDKDKGVIQLGSKLTEQDRLVKVNSNILCGLDSRGDMKCIYLVPTEFID